MHKSGSREFTEDDYMAFAGVEDDPSDKPRIAEFDDGEIYVYLLLAHTIDRAIVVEIEVLQGDFEDFFYKDFASFSDAKELFLELEKDFERYSFTKSLFIAFKHSFKSAF